MFNLCLRRNAVHCEVVVDRFLSPLKKELLGRTWQGHCNPDCAPGGLALYS